MARRCRLRSASCLSRSASCRSRSARARSAWEARSARPALALGPLAGLNSGCTLLAVISWPFRWLALGRACAARAHPRRRGARSRSLFDRAGQGAGGQLGRDLRIGDRGAEGGGHLLLQRPGASAGSAGQRLPGQRGDQLAARRDSSRSLPPSSAWPAAAGRRRAQPAARRRPGRAHQPVDDPRRAGRLAQAVIAFAPRRVTGRAGPRRELAPAPDEFRPDRPRTVPRQPRAPARRHRGCWSLSAATSSIVPRYVA